MTEPSRVDHRIDELFLAIADTNRNINALTPKIDVLIVRVDKLADLMDRHLRHDHGYGDED